MNRIIVFLAVVLHSNCSVLADITYGTNGATYSQNFDSLAATGTSNIWANDSTISGWHLFRRTSSADTTPVAVTEYDSGPGTSTTGKFWSFGLVSNSDRVLGGIGSGSSTQWGSAPGGQVAGWQAASFTNTTGSTLTMATISFRGEQWRDGGNNPAVSQSMTLEYGFGTTFGGVATWNAPGGNFNWASPVFTNTTSGAAVDGNVAGLVAGRGGTINGLNWANNQRLFIRWIEINDAGNDHGLAIDNFQFSAIPEPRSLAFLAGVIAMGMIVARRRFLKSP